MILEEGAEAEAALQMHLGQVRGCRARREDFAAQIVRHPTRGDGRLHEH